jgi:bifunctional non-homologous end joining protein LigD
MAEENAFQIISFKPEVTVNLGFDWTFSSARGAGVLTCYFNASPPAAMPRVSSMALPPRHVQPMLAVPGIMPANPDRFRFELKHDGYRCLIRFDGRTLQMLSRNNQPLERVFPEVRALADELPGPLLLDGELVALDRRGRPSYSALQGRISRKLRGSSPAPVADRIVVMLFDILHLRGRSTVQLAYAQRRRLLEELTLKGPAWETPPATADGAGLLRFVREHGLEGIVAKRLTSTYQPGERSPDWIKIKIVQTEEFVVGGYYTRADGREFSALLLGHFVKNPARGAKLRYAGKTGMGFSEQERSFFRDFIDRHRIASSPFDGPTKDDRRAVFCRPLLVVEVDFNEYTHHGILRHKVFKRLRPDRVPSDIVRAPANASPSR